MDRFRQQYTEFCREEEEEEKVLTLRYYDLSRWIDECRTICSRSEESKEAEKACVGAMKAISDAENSLKGRIEGETRFRAEENLRRARERLKEAEEKLARAQPKALLEQMLQNALRTAIARGRVRTPDYGTFLRARGSDLLLAFVMKCPHARDYLLRGELPSYPWHKPMLVVAQAAGEQVQPGQGNDGSPKPYVEINLAGRTLTIGETIMMPSDKVWVFLKELADTKRLDCTYLKPSDYKNAVTMLRRRIRRDQMPFVVDSTEKGYKLAVGVVLKGGGQMGILQTKPSR